MKPIAPRFSLETHGGVKAVIFYPNDGIDGVRIVLSDSAEPSTYNEQLTRLVREHAALVAVAEAAKILADGIALCAGRWPQDEKILNEALANLADVREGKAVQS